MTWQWRTAIRWDWPSGLLSEIDRDRTGRWNEAV